jgi:DNA-binding MarR family transcriptional regulator
MKTDAMEKFTRRMFTRIITTLARTLADEELSVGQVAALYLVDDRGTMRVSDVAEATGRALPAASRMVDDLVRRGFLEREEDPSDRRARVLTLTASGRRFITQAGADRVRTIKESLPADLASQVAKLITKRG